MKQKQVLRIARSLYKRVSDSGASSWLLNVQINGRRTMMGLGSAEDVSEDEAKALAAKYIQLAKIGRDPIRLRNGAKKFEKGLITLENIQEASALDPESRQFPAAMLRSAKPFREYSVSGFYFLYDGQPNSLRLWYIGSSRNVYERVQEHFRAKSKNAHCSAVAIHLCRYDVAIRYEELYVRLLDPPGNSQLRPHQKRLEEIVINGTNGGISEHGGPAPS